MLLLVISPPHNVQSTPFLTLFLSHQCLIFSVILLLTSVTWILAPLELIFQPTLVLYRSPGGVGSGFILKTWESAASKVPCFPYPGTESKPEGWEERHNSGSAPWSQNYNIHTSGNMMTLADFSNAYSLAAMCPPRKKSGQDGTPERTVDRRVIYSFTCLFSIYIVPRLDKNQSINKRSINCGLITAWERTTITTIWGFFCFIFLPLFLFLGEERILKGPEWSKNALWRGDAQTGT